jgi:Ni/Fe-hydrogenase subunit HybB-like protein
MKPLALNKISWPEVTVWRALGLLFVIAGGYAAVLRFTKGLGAVTNLSDTFPWGMWVGFDVLCGVALAAGGFTVSAMVHVFHRERYLPIARGAVLTAFIGYLMVVGGLAFDLGHPLRIWHPIVMWNPHSVMFEVAWCVTLYTLVLAAEVSLMVFEKLRWKKATRIAKNLTFPLTIAAVLLSMLHQSSLGSLFLIVPGRLHELWYTPWLPVLFFVSAAAVGLAMTIMEANLAGRTFRHEPEFDALSRMGGLAAIVLSLYVVIRISDLVARGALSELRLDRPGIFFLGEIAIGFVLPAVLFSLKRVRRNTLALYHTAQLVVLGVVVNRLNVSVTGFEVVSGHTYIPKWSEVAVTLMLITIGVGIYHWSVKHLSVLDAEEEGIETSPPRPARSRETLTATASAIDSGGGARLC